MTSLSDSCRNYLELERGFDIAEGVPKSQKNADSSRGKSGLVLGVLEVFHSGQSADVQKPVASKDIHKYVWNIFSTNRTVIPILKKNNVLTSKSCASYLFRLLFPAYEYMNKSVVVDVYGFHVNITDTHWKQNAYMRRHVTFHLLTLKVCATKTCF